MDNSAMRVSTSSLSRFHSQLEILDCPSSLPAASSSATRRTCLANWIVVGSALLNGICSLFQGFHGVTIIVGTAAIEARRKDGNDLKHVAGKILLIRRIAFGIDDDDFRSELLAQSKNELCTKSQEPVLVCDDKPIKDRKSV